jgi:hypothetical protein
VTDPSGAGPPPLRRIRWTRGLAVDVLLLAAFLGVVLPDRELIRAVCGVAGALLLAVRVLVARRRSAERPQN